MEPNAVVPAPAVDSNPSSIVRTYIAGIRPYHGECEDLVRFLSEVDDIVPTLAILSDLEIMIRFKQILSKLEGKAYSILIEKPQTWDEAKTLLIRAFSDNTDLGTMIIQMERIFYQGSIQATYEKILAAQIRIIHKIELSNDPMEEKILFIRTCKRRAFMQLRKILPQAAQGALTSRGCDSISEAIQILHQEEFLNYNSFYSDRKIPQYNDNRNNRNFQNKNFQNDSRNFRNNSQQSSPNNSNSNQKNSNMNQHNSNRNNPNRNSNFERSNNNNNKRNFQNNNNFNRRNDNRNQFNRNNFHNQNSHRQNNFQRHYENHQQQPNQSQGSGLNRVHEPMEIENFQILASEQTDCPSSGLN